MKRLLESVIHLLDGLDPSWMLRQIPELLPLKLFGVQNLGAKNLREKVGDLWCSAQYAQIYSEVLKKHGAHPKRYSPYTTPLSLDNHAELKPG